MKKLTFLTAAAAAMALAACTDDLTTVNSQLINGTESPDNVVSFSTNVGKNKQTRGDIGGFTGSMTTDMLKGTKPGNTNPKNSGFGVFAYYTGTGTYGQVGSVAGYRDDTGENKQLFPNFMYNEHVYWDGAALWKYDNLKYWPNEFAKTSDNWSVDDQNNDQSTDPAKVDVHNTNQYYGGNVTFFAYAPWVEVKEQNATAGIASATTKPTKASENAADEGIVAISGNGWNGAVKGEKVEARVGDPYITYVLPSGNETVDLLWGTAGVSDVKANGALQSGQTTGKNPFGNEGLGTGDGTKTIDGKAYTNKPWGNKIGEGNPEYANDILNGYTVNDNLNKMTTTGTVNFVFKHALSKIGGSYVGTGDGDDEDGNTPTNGLMVILDLDKDGAETGGVLQKYTGSDSPAYPTLYNTKVTIDELIVKNTGLQLKSDKSASAADFSYENDTEYLTNKGKLNLATGRWGDYESTVSSGDAKESTQIVVPSDEKTVESADDTKDAILSKEIAEPAANGTTLNGKTKNTQDFFEALPIGVTTVAKNVYETEAQPMVFLPGTKPILEFTITYTVRTYDANLKNAYTEVKQRIKKRLYIETATELNKQYNILMHLGLTSVKFTASVSDWDATSASGTTTGGEEGTSPITVFDEDIEHVWLPINVAGLMLNEAIPTEAGSTAATLATITGATYHSMTSKGQDKVETVEANKIVIEKLNDDGTDYEALGEGWITYNSGTGVLATTPNTEFAPRTMTIRAKYDANSDGTKTSYIYSNNYTITQYGRIPTKATLTLDKAEAVKADGTEDVTPSNVQVTEYYETQADGTADATKKTESVDVTPIGYVTPSWMPYDTENSKFDVAPYTTSTQDREGTIAVKINKYYTVPTNKTVKQKGFKVVLTESSKTITVKDGDNNNIAAEKYTITFPAGTEIDGDKSEGSFKYKFSGEAENGTYTITVEHTDGVSATIGVTKE